MSYFNSNITGANGTGGAAGGLVTKFEKSVKLGEAELAEVTINLSGDIDNYKNITNEQIIVEFDSISSDHVQNTIRAELSHSYNSETGELTITSTSSFVPFRNGNGESIDINIYVVGAVQIPPDVPSQGKFKLYDGEIINKQISASSSLKKVAYVLDLPIGKDLLIFAEASFNVSSGHKCTISIQNEAGNILASRTMSSWGFQSLCTIIDNNQDSRLNMLVADANADSAQNISQFTFKVYEAV